MQRIQDKKCALLFAAVMVHATHGGVRDSNAGEDAVSASFWSFQPLNTSPPPEVAQDAWVRNPIDRFVLARLQAERISPAEQADQYKLIRRAYFDLWGTPPAPRDVEALVTDRSPHAYETMVDRLLNSPRYGERWARHWLDISRFAESNGFEMDEDRLGAFHYRDFVIRALNQDMPYDQFVRWQLAGDLLAPQNPLAQSATGFLVAGVENVIQTEKDYLRDRYDKMDDMATTVGTAMLGLTIGCARCHDHKYDPLTQREYYQFLSSFARTVSAEVPLANTAGSDKAYAAVDVAGDWTKEGKRGFIVGTDKSRFVLSTQIYLLERGEVGRPQELVQQRFPAVLAGTRIHQHEERRVALADWITDVKHGGGTLLARVIINRLWQHHFGRGLVETPSDFGSRGSRPTHPELLDWLATQLIRHEWRLKPIHRLMMTSATYRQTHVQNAAATRPDPTNGLLWRRHLRRLDAEAIRDAMLAVSGQLDARMYGAGTLEQSTPRRSIYLTVKRSRRIPILQALDAPDPLQGVGKRQTTTVAPQSLLMLNNALVRNYAESFANRLPRSNLSQAIEQAFLIGLSRPPHDEERRQLQRYLGHRRQEDSAGAALDTALSDLCQLLICSNEFAYVE